MDRLVMRHLIPNFVTRPTKVAHCADGKTRCQWYVDDNDDRYVEVIDSTGSGDVLVLVRDCGRASCTVLRGQEKILAGIGSAMHELSQGLILTGG